LNRKRNTANKGMHQIENEFLRVKAREFGAELTSVWDKKTNTEHLWQADPKFWGWHAPVLFPVVGRSLHDEILIDGIAYQMEKHGFARKSNFRLLELGDSKMTFSLTDSEETRKLYPYKFEFLISYHLKENQLSCSYEVINQDNKPVYFQLGGHPAFAVPFNNGEALEDYYLEFEHKETSARHLINTDGYFDGRTEPVLNNSATIQLRKDLFKDDALIFKDLKSRVVSIKSKKHSKSLSVRFDGFKYLGLWAKENAPYVCIEPWLGCADTVGRPMDFSDREGIIALLPEEEFQRSFVINIR
jgi:galactose mutarotase-like enzyme